MPDPISWAHDWPYYVGALVFGYLLGSVPFGLVVTRMAGLGDIRRMGSGNIGATNVLRTGSKGLAALMVLLDGLKGTVATVLASRYGGPDMAVVAGFAVFIGHCFPVWLKFRGGKGVATFLGVLLGLAWPIMLVTAAIWIAVAALTRYSSVAALVSSASAPALLAMSGQIQFAELFAVLAVLVWLRHHANIRRLLRGKESRIGS